MQINEYPVEQFTLNDSDWFDIDAFLGANYETRKVSWATIKSEIGAENIGNANLTITDTGFRDLTLGGALPTDGWRVLDTGGNPALEVLGDSKTNINSSTENIAKFENRKVDLNVINDAVDVGFSFYGIGSYRPELKIGSRNADKAYITNYDRGNPNTVISSAFQISHYSFAGDDGGKMNFNQTKSAYGTFSGFNFLCPDSNTLEPTDADRIAWISKDGTLGMFNQAGSTVYTQKADSFEMYAKDIVAGNSAPHFRTEAGDLIKLYKQDLPTNPTNAEIATLLSNLGLANLV